MRGQCGRDFRPQITYVFRKGRGGESEKGRIVVVVLVLVLELVNKFSEELTTDYRLLITEYNPLSTLIKGECLLIF